MRLSLDKPLTRLYENDKFLLEDWGSDKDGPPEHVIGWREKVPHRDSPLVEALSAPSG